MTERRAILFVVLAEKKGTEGIKERERRLEE
jgi:hypothetical protein